MLQRNENNMTPKKKEMKKQKSPKPYIVPSAGCCADVPPEKP